MASGDGGAIQRREPGADETALALDPAPVREILGITCRPFHPEFSE